MQLDAVRRRRRRGRWDSGAHEKRSNAILILQHHLFNGGTAAVEGLVQPVAHVAICQVPGRRLPLDRFTQPALKCDVLVCERSACGCPRREPEEAFLDRVQCRSRCGNAHRVQPDRCCVDRIRRGPCGTLLVTAFTTARSEAQLQRTPKRIAAPCKWTCPWWCAGDGGLRRRPRKPGGHGNERTEADD